jgi:tetratricopeptide (TPR) repeat protein
MLISALVVLIVSGGCRQRVRETVSSAAMESPPSHDRAAAASNPVAPTNSSPSAAESDAEVEKEYKKLMADDDAAQAEVDGWIRENQEFAAKGATVPKAGLSGRIRARLEPVRQAYEDFIKRHPGHAQARIAYASLLEDVGDEDGELAQLEKARELGPTIPSVWNNLANYYGHNGSVKKAFEYYAKAIELEPSEPVYYQNFATTVYLFRKDATEYYGITEQQVFDKALDLYNKAMKLDPSNFPLATDLAQSYYGIRPVRTEEALQAWTNALNIAHDEIEREGVYIHLARFKLNAGRFAEAREQLNAVTNEMYAVMKRQLTRNLDERENQAKGTNNPPVTVTTNAAPVEHVASPDDEKK